MATALSLDDSVVLSVSADHLVGRYDVDVRRLPPLGPRREPLPFTLLNQCTGEPGFGRLRRDGAQDEAPGERCGRNTRRGTCVRHRGLGRPVSHNSSSRTVPSFVFVSYSSPLIFCCSVDPHQSPK